MKRNLKESVRDIRNMIGRIDHPTIVEGPGDEGEIGMDKVEKNINVQKVVKPVAPNVQKDIENQIMSYITDNRDAAEVKSALFKKVPGLNLGPSTKLGGLIKAFEEMGADLKMSPLGKQPISVDAKIGDKFKLSADIDGKVFNVPFTLHMDTTLLQKEKGVLKLTKGLKFGGVNVDLTIPIDYTNKKVSQLSKGKLL